MKCENLYKVTFNEYTNGLRDTVAKYDGSKYSLKASTDYVHIPFNGLIIRESELEYYAQFGEGFASCECIGSLYPEVLSK